MKFEINHIGYLVKTIDLSIDAFKELGFSVDRIIYDEFRKAQLCFMSKEGYCVELIAPSRESELYGLIKKYKNTAYHICYSVEDLDEAIAFLEDKGYFTFKEQEPAPAFGEGAEVVFLMNSDVGMVELLQERKKVRNQNGKINE